MERLVGVVSTKPKWEISDNDSEGLIMLLQLASVGTTNAPLVLVLDIVLIMIGAMAMSIGIYQTKGLFSILPLVVPAQRKWLSRRIYLQSTLMVFFLFGYVAVAVGLAIHPVANSSIILVAVIFLLGSGFVLLNVSLQQRLLRSLTSTFHELIPMCAWCKKIRKSEKMTGESDAKQWCDLETYLGSRERITHTLCPACKAEIVREAVT